ncbi:hypothetical protein D3C76_1416380 [compost metagenome]
MKLDLQQTALFLALGLSGKVQHNLGADRLVHIDLVKINMEQIAVQRVALHILDHHRLFACCAQLQLNNTAGMGFQEPRQLPVVHLNQRGRRIFSVYHTRHAAGGTELFYPGFGQIAPGLGLQCYSHNSWSLL